MRRNFSIGDLVDQVKDHAEHLQKEGQEKTASARAPESFTSDIAASMQKLASELRETDPHCVTHADVQEFARGLMERK